MESPEEFLYHDVEPTLRERFIKLLRPEPRGLLDDQVTYNPWQDLNCAYIFCDEDQIIPPSRQKKMAALLPVDTPTFKMPTSHSPFLSNPKLLASHIETCASMGYQKSREVL